VFCYHTAQKVSPAILGKIAQANKTATEKDGKTKMLHSQT